MESPSRSPRSSAEPWAGHLSAWLEYEGLGVVADLAQHGLRRQPGATLVRRVIPLLLFILALSACKVRVDALLVIEEDESGTLTLEVSADQELRDLAESQGGSEITLNEEIPDGWTFEDFTDGDFEGGRITTSFGSLDELRSRLSEFAETAGTDNGAPDFISQVQVTREGDLFNFRADLAGLEDGLGAAVGGELDASVFLADLFDIRMVLTMPGTIVTSNADATAESTLTWNLSTNDDGRILEAQSDLGAARGGPVIGLIVLVLVIAVVGYVVIQRRKGQRDSELAATDA